MFLYTVGRQLHLEGRTVSEQAEVDMMIDVAGDYRGPVTGICYRYYRGPVTGICYTATGTTGDQSLASATGTTGDQSLASATGTTVQGTSHWHLLVLLQITGYASVPHAKNESKYSQ